MKTSKAMRDHLHAEHMKQNFWIKKAKCFLAPIFIPLHFVFVILCAVADGVLVFSLALASGLSCVYDDYCRGYFSKLYLHLRYWNKKSAADYICYSTLDGDE